LSSNNFKKETKGPGRKKGPTQKQKKEDITKLRKTKKRGWTEQEKAKYERR